MSKDTVNLDELTQEDLPPYEVHYRAGTQQIFEALQTTEALSRRTFASGNDYKKKMGLTGKDAAKQDFRSHMKTTRGLLPHFEKAYKSKLPPKSKAAGGSSQNHGFHRSVILSHELTAFLKCSEWGMISSADPKSGFMVALAVGSAVTTYVFLNNLSDPENGSVWECDEAMTEVFKKAAIEKNVDLTRMQQTDLQKLLPLHETSVKAEDRSEPKLDELRKKCQDDGEFGKVLHDIKLLKEEMAEAKKQVQKSNKSLVACLATRANQPITEVYKTEVRTGSTRYNEAAAKIKVIAQANDLKFAEDFPRPLVTALDQ